MTRLVDRPDDINANVLRAIHRYLQDRFIPLPELKAIKLKPTWVATRYNFNGCRVEIEIGNGQIDIEAMLTYEGEPPSNERSPVNDARLLHRVIPLEHPEALELTYQQVKELAQYYAPDLCQIHELYAPKHSWGTIEDMEP